MLMLMSEMDLDVVDEPNNELHNCYRDHISPMFDYQAAVLDH